MRAARLGFEVSVDDKKLYFRKRVDSDSGIKLVFGVPGESALERFMPRLSTAQQVSEVKVFGWDPVKKQEIIGIAKPQSSKLGDKSGSGRGLVQAQGRPSGRRTSRRSPRRRRRTTSPSRSSTTA